MNGKNIKEIVKDKYASIAKQRNNPQKCRGVTSCCDSSNADYSMFNDDYSNLRGYNADADLGLGCGIPTEYAQIKKGDTVLDLGSGAGNDVFVARQIVGEKGKVIGLDMTEEMIDKAIINNQTLGYKNVEFILGDIEEMPVEDQSIDVVVSNCVLNLVPNKMKAFNEIFRVLKSDGHFCISDIVIKGKLTDELRKSAELYAGCVSGALEEDDYLRIVKDSGFNKIKIQKRKRVEIPETILNEYLSNEDIEDFKKDITGIFSITVVGYK
ncbi:MAG TPA: arsenite methyltransferase [Ignavibacteria bacterium]|nr:arsenite methyltransferase [Ignavibacteria bacterium]